MTKQIFMELVNAYGGPDNVVSLVFDNDKIENFIRGKRFSFDMVKNYGGMDFIELTKALRSKSNGTYDIETKTLHKLECLQCIGFVNDNQRMDDVDSAQFVHYQ